MAFEQEFETLNSCFRKDLGASQIKAELKLLAKENSTIAKILCVNVKSLPQQVTFANGEANSKINVIFELMYSSEDGNVYSVTDSILVENNYKNNEIKENMFPLVKSQVVDFSAVNVRPKSVNINAIIDILFNATACENIKVLKGSENNDLVTKKEIIEYCKMINQDTVNFEVEEEFETKQVIENLLMQDACLCIKECYAGTGYIVVKGKVNLNLTYLKNEETNQIMSLQKSFDFKEEIEAENVVPECFIDVLNSIEFNNIDININTVDNNTLVSAIIPIKCSYSALHKQKEEVITDAFSTTNMLNLTYESFTKCKFNMFKQVNETITGSASIENQNAEIEKVVSDCSNNVMIASAFSTDGFVTIEGVAQLNVIYYTLTENKELMQTSMKIQIPYSVDVDCAVATPKSKVFATASIKDANLTAKRGKDFEVDVELCLYYDIWENEEDLSISNVEMGEQIQEENASLQMFLVKKSSTLWDICKYVQARPETIIKQNKNLKLPLEKDTMIIVFKQKQEKY